MALSRAAESLETLEALEDPLSSFQVPEALCNALTSTGVSSVPDFAFAYNDTAELNRFCTAPYEQLWQDLQVDAPAHSPAMARLRPMSAAADSQHTTVDTSPASALPLNSWAEHAPGLDQATIAQLTADFKSNYPGKHLDGDAMPSVRLLSIVHKWFAPGSAITWVPWQLRLSQKQYQEIIESKATKTLRTEAQFLSTALFDETPEMPVDHLRLSSAWLGRTQTVFRNAIAICKGAHLARLKAFDKKILDLATHSPTDASLRTVTTAELVSADRRIWQELALLQSQGWTLDDALHELTTEGKEKPNKGAGKGGKAQGTSPGKRREPGAGTATEVKTADLIKGAGCGMAAAFVELRKALCAREAQTCPSDAAPPTPSWEEALLQGFRRGLDRLRSEYEAFKQEITRRVSSLHYAVSRQGDLNDQVWGRLRAINRRLDALENELMRVHQDINQILGHLVGDR
ncbi:unnamed protein product [Symbiodinium sp. CCMP2456]|nr:unnamed protein product [Symbiodinium sp. CCMP2456]